MLEHLDDYSNMKISCYVAGDNKAIIKIDNINESGNDIMNRLEQIVELRKNQSTFFLGDPDIEINRKREEKANLINKVMIRNTEIVKYVLRPYIDRNYKIEKILKDVD